MLYKKLVRIERKIPLRHTIKSSCRRFQCAESDWQKQFMVQANRHEIYAIYYISTMRWRIFPPSIRASAARFFVVVCELQNIYFQCCDCKRAVYSRWCLVWISMHFLVCIIARAYNVVREAASAMLWLSSYYPAREKKRSHGIWIIFRRLTKALTWGSVFVYRSQCARL